MYIERKKKNKIKKLQRTPAIGQKVKPVILFLVACVVQTRVFQPIFMWIPQKTQVNGAQLPIKDILYEISLVKWRTNHTGVKMTYKIFYKKKNRKVIHPPCLGGRKLKKKSTISRKLQTISQVYCVIQRKSEISLERDHCDC